MKPNLLSQAIETKGNRQPMLKKPTMTEYEGYENRPWLNGLLGLKNWISEADDSLSSIKFGRRDRLNLNLLDEELMATFGKNRISYNRDDDDFHNIKWSWRF